MERWKDKLILAGVIGALVLGSLRLRSKPETGMAQGFVSGGQTEVETVTEMGGMVHLAGAVQNPGVYAFEAGQRLDDVIRAAGGLLENADASQLNLSIRLKDEMKITVPVEGQGIEAQAPEPVVLTAEADDRIDINRADKSQLMTLTGIGEKRAQDIINYREHTPFKSIEDLKNVSGIGDKTFEGLKDDITVGTEG